MAKYPDGLLIKDSDGPWNPFINYYIIEDEKRRRLTSVEQMGQGEKKNHTIKINTLPSEGFKGIMGLMKMERLLKNGI